MTPAKTQAMQKKIERFESVLYGKKFDDPVEGWRKYLDEDSAVDYYLESEFIKNWDGDFFLSTYFFTDDYTNPDAKLFMGPIWDLDRSAASKTDAGTHPVTSPKGWWLDGSGVAHASSHDVHKTHWFTQITKDKEFQKALEARWAEKKSTFKASGDTGVEAAASELGSQAAANDRAMWQKVAAGRARRAAGEDVRRRDRLLKKWYQARYRWMDDQLD